MIDAHCHLNFDAFKDDYEDVLERAFSRGVKFIINAGTQISSSEWAVRLAKKHENLYALVAVHPHHADKVGADWIWRLEALAKEQKVLGIGELGLDYYNYKSNGIVEPKLQKEILMAQLELAHKYRLPLQIHSRDENARVELIRILKTHRTLLQKIPGMFHCMAGTLESVKDALDLGFFLGFDGNITYKGKPPGEPVELRDLVEYTPIERIVIETDSPYLSPEPYRGDRNEPSRAIIIAQAIAKIKGISPEKVIEHTTQNVYTIFDRLKR